MIFSALITVQGIVQGVGFRPFLHKLALNFNLAGYTLNSPRGVVIEVEGDKESIENFYEAITEKHPAPARIVYKSFTYQEPRGFCGFKIEKSQAGGHNSIFMSPDLALCSDCRRELLSPSDRRHGYPFINCTNCGPRYTIIKNIPYDRPFTTMASFKMCPSCQEEYDFIEDRRYHAQPDCCSLCGPHLFWTGSDGSKVTDNPLQIASKALREGKIIALKGLGGFHLVCDATNDRAVEVLRKRKNRPHKPFAVMFPGVDILNSYVYLNPKGEALLSGSISPIVMLNKKDERAISPLVAPNLKYLGVMIPYTPLHEMLFKTGNFKALVMTSGNLQDEPIQIDNDECLKNLGPLVDGFLFHNRPIARRCDDSVVKISSGKIQVLRRARGYTPLPMKLDFFSSPCNDFTILACGAELKNSFSIYKEGFVFLSPHTGDLQNFETLSYYEETVEEYKKLFDINPSVIAYDMHPSYLSTGYALKQNVKTKIPVQHHHAHFASCLLEHEIKEKAIGVIFDGTGYGSDGNIWGGEFFAGDYREFLRFAHLKYHPMPGGDLAAMEPYRMALSYLYGVFGENLPEVNCIKFQDIKKIKTLIKMMDKKLNCPLTSSMGRLFDAVSSILDICHISTYEGQAAMELEAKTLADIDETYHYVVEEGAESLIVEPGPVIKGILSDLEKGISQSFVSTKFHNTVVAFIVDICKRIRKLYLLNTVVLSGGVFQNSYLADRARFLLEKEGFRVLENSVIPPNDGGISFGQVAVAYSIVGVGSKPVRFQTRPI